MSFVLSNTTIYPCDLLEEFGALEGERRWCVAYTKVRQEKRLAEDLTSREVPFYLPLIERSHMYRGRRLRSQEPLFGSYVFLFANQDEREQSLTTKRIATCCRWLMAASFTTTLCRSSVSLRPKSR